MMSCLLRDSLRTPASAIIGVANRAKTAANEPRAGFVSLTRNTGGAIMLEPSERRGVMSSLRACVRSAPLSLCPAFLHRKPGYSARL